ncbi:hypothetical protein EXIGLDRAFT_726152 [Exidia glandulosa HHB12029]|uniref:Malic enzyme n=1 Tax=Exidia glandulosa HHB12029 TaxID=1314781 RepID=A0A165ZS28_EXIGL|nr:hypothetical protein EXIGLDRAFT_726152 [Exidia glandulosa HHB12029]
MTKTPRTLKLALRGEALLEHPQYNKGTAFSARERNEFGLVGRLPVKVNTLDHQCERAYQQLKTAEKPIQQNEFLQSVKVQNWVLYYSLLGRHLRELMPIIYTPTEAEAIANYSRSFRRPEGLFLTFCNADSMEADYLEQTRGRTIDLIVCSDAEAILGIGDQGVGGIGISTAKSAVYTLVAGIDPANTLCVVLDVGTNNKSLLDDPLYIGWPHARVRGAEYDAFVDKFVQLVRKHHPHSLLHFEDFGVDNAQRLLELYRDKHAVFNDDVQGTGAVTLATLMSAVGVTKSKLSDQRIIVYGAGTAGLGIAAQIRDAMVVMDGVRKEDASGKFYMIDKFGLLTKGLKQAGKTRQNFPDDFIRTEDDWTEGQTSLLDVVKRVKATVLIGTSTHAGAFTREVVEAMAAHCDRPVILPLSNPSKLVEVHPKDANDWTGGKALIATGSPFEPVKMPNGKKDYVIAECNNALIYPGLGFGCILSKSRSLTDTMLIAGTRALASLSPALKDPDDSLLPDFGDAPDVNFHVAVAVAEQAIEEGSAGVEWGKDEVKERARQARWEPVYQEYVYDVEGLRD